MQIVRVTADNSPAFQKLMSERMQLQLRVMENVFALGVIEEDIAAGVIGIQLQEDGAADIIYLFVLPEFRRRRLATELMYSAMVVVQRHEGFMGMRFAHCENMLQESGLIQFFKFCGFDIEEDADQITYYCEVGELQDVKIGELKHKENIICYNKLSSGEKDWLRQEPPEMVSLAMDINLIEPELSAFTINDNEISACVVFVERDDSLVLAWGRASKSGMNFMYLLEYALELLKSKYKNDKKLIIPAINEASVNLCRKILGDIVKPMEMNYSGVLMFDDESNDEDE